MIRMNRRSLREATSRELSVSSSIDVASASRSFPLLAAAAMTVLLTSATASARETKLGSIGFELPKDWKIQMDGTERLTASPSGAPDTPPLVMAEFCVPNSARPCPAAEAPNAEKTGCVEPQFNTKNGLTQSMRNAGYVRESPPRQACSTLLWAISWPPHGHFAWCISLRTRISHPTNSSTIWPRLSAKSDVTVP